ncbi:hypothetical protein Ciccas_005649 [Cichlidogyrus casuarinus]|uniref:Uncharacterized protein n=1 Tax=Cichlidogyrus casuarinus TaxID=1844966 RepID=A0ABD2Q8J1_9PLAT
MPHHHRVRSFREKEQLYNKLEDYCNIQPQPTWVFHHGGEEEKASSEKILVTKWTHLRPLISEEKFTRGVSIPNYSRKPHKGQKSLLPKPKKLVYFPKDAGRQVKPKIDVSRPLEERSKFERLDLGFLSAVK